MVEQSKIFFSALFVSALFVAQPLMAQQIVSAQENALSLRSDFGEIQLQGEILPTLNYPDVPVISNPFSLPGELPDEEIPQIESLEDAAPRALGQDSAPISNAVSDLARLAQPSVFRVIGVGDAAGAIRALVSQPDAFLNQLAKWSVSDQARSSQCKTASQSLVSSSNSELLNFLDKPTTKRPLSDAERQILQAYSDGCFRQVFSSSTGGEPNYLPQLRKRAGLIRIQPSRSDPSNVIYCSAFLTDASTAVTARHCLYRATLDTTGTRPTIRIWPGGLTFLSLGIETAAEIEFRISEPSSLPEPKSWTPNVAEDFVTITLNQPIQGVVPITIGGEPDPFIYDHIIQVGYYNNFAVLSGRRSNFSLDDLRASYAVDESDTCTVLRYSEFCIIQTCQSMTQTSGAVLLGIKDNSLSVLGTLHGRPQNRLVGNGDCFKSNVAQEIVLSTNITSRAQ